MNLVERRHRRWPDDHRHRVIDDYHDHDHRPPGPSPTTRTTAAAATTSHCTVIMSDDDVMTPGDARTRRWCSSRTKRRWHLSRSLAPGDHQRTIITESATTSAKHQPAGRLQRTLS